jgi:hypothetical protein
MADHKELESLDKIFRSTFDGLQDTPAPNGWDTPSDRVWAQVQQGIGKRDNGWTPTKTMVAAAAVAVVVALGLYLAFRPTTPATETPQEQPAVVVTPAILSTAPVQFTAPVPAEKPVEIAPERKKQPQQSGNKIGPMQPAAVPNSFEKQLLQLPLEPKINTPAETPVKPAVKPPNSVERNKIKEQQKGTFKMIAPLNTLPPHNSTTPPPVPASLKNIPWFSGQE